ncbi:hypothetical protein COT99_02110 [Candidatus Falkowbacteria bacterium CG10_big_fil_rev_8_21_14_0_10_43_10]|uniref:Uncharacterized protein n=1 Tax=Candidatus Falkowbacteria bacterium CG10_big_fil_rev_8_21_14_0_10_43_10 TaxID=1974567 RepID=A0A2H0V2B8_9BACT|nr:MAG: hypothetical protein COT99_02110 [Candidatus Falkowbacteria bacterium CG10_big_fil_rev_8_21_14_0_10_43_10]
MKNQQEVIQQIADQIIAAAGADKMPEGAKAAFRENLEAQIMRRLGLIIIKNLDEEGLKAYEKLTEAAPVPSVGEMQSFLEQYLPDYEEKVKAGMDEFMAEIAGHLNKKS